MEQAMTRESLIERIVQLNAKLGAIHYIYVFFNLPFNAVFLLKSVQTAYAAVTNMRAATPQMIAVLFVAAMTGLIQFGYVMSCVGVLLRKSWGRLLVLLLSATMMTLGVLSILVQWMFGSWGLGFGLAGPTLWSFVWFVLFYRSKLTFMNHEQMRRYLEKHYDKHSDVENRTCLLCENWDGARSKHEENRDAKCLIDDTYHKGREGCSNFFPYVS